MQQPEERSDFAAFLRCLVCNKDFEHCTLDHPQPYGGLVFRSSGNYGSRIFDPFHDKRRIVALVCDDCVRERIDRVALEEVRRVLPTVTYASLANVSELPES